MAAAYRALVACSSACSVAKSARLWPSFWFSDNVTPSQRDGRHDEDGQHDLPHVPHSLPD